MKQWRESEKKRRERIREGGGERERNIKAMKSIQSAKISVTEFIHTM